MALARKMGITLFYQAIGVIAMALVNVIIAQRYGAEGQGFLSYYRSTVLFLVQLGLLGLPQALVFMLNSGKTEIQWAVRFSTWYAFACLIIGSGLLLIFWSSSSLEGFGFGTYAAIAILLATFGSLLHELYRAIALATRSVLTFNIISIMPAVLAFILFAVWRATDFNDLVMVLVIASIISTLVAAVILKINPFPFGELKAKLSAEKYRFSFSYGIFSFAPAILFHLLAVVTYSILRSDGDAAAGQFSVAILILTFVLMPLERVTPLLFDSWSKRQETGGQRSSFVALAHAGPLLIIIGVVSGAFFVGPAIELLFGDEFQPAIFPTQIFLVAGYIFYQTRLQISLLLSLGHPGIVTIAATIRAATILILLFVGSSVSVTHAVYAWVIGESVSLVVTTIWVWRMTGWSLPELVGCSPGWYTRFLAKRSIPRHNPESVA